MFGGGHGPRPVQKTASQHACFSGVGHGPSLVRKGVSLSARAARTIAAFCARRAHAQRLGWTTDLAQSGRLSLSASARAAHARTRRFAWATGLAQSGTSPPSARARGRYNSVSARTSRPPQEHRPSPVRNVCRMVTATHRPAVMASGANVRGQKRAASTVWRIWWPSSDRREVSNARGNLKAKAPAKRGRTVELREHSNSTVLKFAGPLKYDAVVAWAARAAECKTSFFRTCVETAEAQGDLQGQRRPPCTRQARTPP